MNLRGRVERLERAIGVSGSLIDFFVRFRSPDGTGEVGTITSGNQFWHRRQDEAVEALMERARAEAAEPPPNCVRLFICDPTEAG